MMYAGNQAIKDTKNQNSIYHIINILQFSDLNTSNTIEYNLTLILKATAPNSVYNQLLGWWVANQNQNTKQNHPSLNAQGHPNWIRQRFVRATGHTRGRWQQAYDEQDELNQF
jgi:hypothetical protein